MGLIVIEGLDAAGKGTQSRLLLEALEKQPGGARAVQFPDYASPSSSLVKMYLAGEFGTSPDAVNPYAAAAFYAVDRFASYQKDWKQDYQNGVTILADRYVTANQIFQLEKLPRDQWEDFLLWVEDFEYGKLGLPRPDRVIFLDMPVEVSQKLLLKRYHGDEKQKDIHESDRAFLERCALCARFAAERLGWQTILCAEDGEPRPVEDIHREVLALAGL